MHKELMRLAMNRTTASFSRPNGLCLIAMIVCLSAALNTAAQTTTDSPWVATWGTAMVDGNLSSPPDFTGETLRLIVHTSLGGPQARIWISNRFGHEPLHIGAAHIAISTQAAPQTETELSAIKPESDRALTFSHLASVTVAPGSTIASDPVALDVPPLSNLAVSLYFPERTLGATLHGGAQQLSYFASGDVTSKPTFGENAWNKGSWYFLTGVDVYAPGSSAVVAFGDSITDGNHSTRSANRRWPDYLAARLAADDATRKAGVLGVVNTGISGNRVLLDGDGPNGMARMEWDILARSGVRYLILFHGINDIEAVTRNHQPYGTLVQDLEQALTQITQQAHEHGILVIGATQMTDCRNFTCTWPEGEKVRNALNDWVRTAPIFDGMVDFDKVMRDPQYPTQMLGAYNSGDFVHPNDTGYKAMGDAIDLSFFARKSKNK